VRAQEETGAAVFYSQVESVCWGLGLNQKQQAPLWGPSQGKTFLDDDFGCVIITLVCDLPNLSNLG